MEAKNDAIAMSPTSAELGALLGPQFTRHGEWSHAALAGCSRAPLFTPFVSPQLFLCL